jgi:hypothetical protein
MCKPRTPHLPGTTTAHIYTLLLSNARHAASNKNWGKADIAALARLVHNRDVDIKNLSSNYIAAVGKEYFCHQSKKNFCRNFCNFAATFNLEAKYSRARRREGKSMGFPLLYYSGLLSTPTPPLVDNRQS